MNAEGINALSTAVIAFVTVIASMVGFYFNLRGSNTESALIILLELFFVVAVLVFIRWIKRRGGFNG